MHPEDDEHDARDPLQPVARAHRRARPVAIATQSSVNTALKPATCTTVGMRDGPEAIRAGKSASPAHIDGNAGTSGSTHGERNDKDARA